MIEELFRLLESECHNRHYFHRYKRFIMWSAQRYKSDSPSEKHHVLPVSMFPEYRKTKQNIAKLGVREHFICHWMLAKATNSPKMWFAFNMMKRVIDGDTKTSLLYAYSRKYVAQAVSDSNTGRTMSEKNRNEMSKRHKGLINVRDKNGDVLRIRTDDPRYVSGELQHFSVGRKNNQESINNLKAKSGIRGKVRYYNPITGQVRYFISVPVGTEWVAGSTQEERTHMSKMVSNSIWVTNLEDGISKRVPSGQPIPEGFIIGRGNFNNIGAKLGAACVNVIDLETRTLHKLPKEMIDKTRHIMSPGKDRNKCFVFTFDGCVFGNSKTLLAYMREENIFIDQEILYKDVNMFESYVVKAPYATNTPESKRFRQIHQGKTLFQLGLLRYHYTDINVELLRGFEKIWI